MSKLNIEYQFEGLGCVKMSAPSNPSAAFMAAYLRWLADFMENKTILEFEPNPCNFRVKPVMSAFAACKQCTQVHPQTAGFVCNTPNCPMQGSTR